MPKVDVDKLKSRYEKARQDWQAHQKREREQRKKQKAKADTERKIIAGEMLLSLVESGEWPPRAHHVPPRHLPERQPPPRPVWPSAPR